MTTGSEGVNMVSICSPPMFTPPPDPPTTMLYETLQALEASAVRIALAARMSMRRDALNGSMEAIPMEYDLTVNGPPSQMDEESLKGPRGPETLSEKAARVL